VADSPHAGGSEFSKLGEGECKKNAESAISNVIFSGTICPILNPKSFLELETKREQLFTSIKV
jgi:hypothetical protein